jgi:hypothetical protein
VSIATELESVGLINVRHIAQKRILLDTIAAAGQIRQQVPAIRAYVAVVVRLGSQRRRSVLDHLQRTVSTPLRRTERIILKKIWVHPSQPLRASLRIGSID